MSEKSSNSSLHRAKDAKKDEFYTQLYDIERELKHYKNHFKNKVVYCNCDDPRVSNFFHYFSYNFEKLGLKKLIATCYKNQERDLFSTHESEQAIYLEYEGDKNNNRVPDPKEIGIKQLKGDGDFRSEESIELLEQADIVVTNPPFSLFREYVAQLVEYDKQFLIIGSQNAITYKEIFPLIAQNKMWLGYNNGDMSFRVPDSYEPRATRYWEDEDGQKWRSMGNIAWFTNLDHSKRHENIILYKKYTSEEYPKYDNYDAININKVAEIPMDYKGVMGVPITFLDKYNPEQFEIVAFRKGDDGKNSVYSLTRQVFDNEMVGTEIAERERESTTTLSDQYSTTRIFTEEYLSDDAHRRTNEQSQRHQSKRQKQICTNTYPATAIPGMIKNAEGKIKDKITYARITIRNKRL